WWKTSNFSIALGWSPAFRRFWAENRLKAGLQPRAMENFTSKQRVKRPPIFPGCQRFPRDVERPSNRVAHLRCRINAQRALNGGKHIAHADRIAGNAH